jgi:4-hydroxybenzoate polyprenyltransferase
MRSEDEGVPDAPRGNWVDRYAPRTVRVYGRLARWDRPIGWWLLLLPCWWSATLAADAAGRSFPDPVILLLFLVGAIAMRGTGCTYNDIVDRDLDAGVARTRSRPIPSGAVTVRAAALFLALQALVGLVVLLQFNPLTIVLGLASLAVVAVYPFLKRFTDFPQLGLGLAFSWGALLGWTAETGAFSAAAFALYAGSVAWTIGYDTIYALQDKEDDALMGVRSTARLFGPRAPLAVAVCYVAAVLLFGLALALAGAGWPAYVGLGLAAAHLAWQVTRIEIADPALALRLFRSNRGFGLVIWAGLVASAALTAS